MSLALQARPALMSYPPRGSRQVLNTPVADALIEPIVGMGYASRMYRLRLSYQKLASPTASFITQTHTLSFAHYCDVY